MSRRSERLYFRFGVDASSPQPTKKTTVVPRWTGSLSPLPLAPLPKDIFHPTFAYSHTNSTDDNFLTCSSRQLPSETQEEEYPQTRSSTSKGEAEFRKFKSPRGIPRRNSCTKSRTSRNDDILPRDSEVEKLSQLEQKVESIESNLRSFSTLLALLQAFLNHKFKAEFGEFAKELDEVSGLGTFDGDNEQPSTSNSRDTADTTASSITSNDTSYSLTAERVAPLKLPASVGNNETSESDDDSCGCDTGDESDEEDGSSEDSDSDYSNEAESDAEVTEEQLRQPGPSEDPLESAIQSTKSEASLPTRKSRIQKKKELTRSESSPRRSELQCPMCKKPFRTRTSKISWEQKRTHNPKKPQKCSSCPKSFYHASDLQRHELIHRNERLCKCSLCCRTESKSELPTAKVKNN